MRTTSLHTVGLEAAERSDRSHAAIGLLLTAVVPAVFWVAIYAAVAHYFGYPADAGTLTIAGLVIASFLGLFFAILTFDPR